MEVTWRQYTPPTPTATTRPLLAVLMAPNQKALLRNFTSGNWSEESHVRIARHASRQGRHCLRLRDVHGHRSLWRNDGSPWTSLSIQRLETEQDAPPPTPSHASEMAPQTPQHPLDVPIQGASLGLHLTWPFRSIWRTGNTHLSSSRSSGITRLFIAVTRHQTTSSWRNVSPGLSFGGVSPWPAAAPGQRHQGGGYGRGKLVTLGRQEGKSSKGPERR